MLPSRKKILELCDQHGIEFVKSPKSGATLVARSTVTYEQIQSVMADVLNVPKTLPRGTTNMDGLRNRTRGTCEKCGQLTNWKVLVVDRFAYWCGCD